MDRNQGTDLVNASGCVPRCSPDSRTFSQPFTRNNLRNAAAVRERVPREGGEAGNEPVRIRTLPYAATARSLRIRSTCRAERASPKTKLLSGGKPVPLGAKEPKGASPSAQGRGPKAAGRSYSSGLVSVRSAVTPDRCAPVQPPGAGNRSLAQVIAPIIP